MFKIQTAIATVAVSAVSSAFGAAYLDNVVNVQATGVITNNVASGEATLSTERITVGENAIVKEGEGTLIIKNALIDQSPTMKVTVLEGGVKLDMEGSAGTPCTQLPESITTNMLWWGKIDDVTGHLVDENGNAVSYTDYGAKVANWYDVRETDTTNPKYHRMTTAFPENGYPTFRKGTNEVYKIYGKTNVATITNEWNGLYFGGYKSTATTGIGMYLTKVGATTNKFSTSNIKMVFAVQGQTSDELGALSGSYSSNYGLFTPYVLNSSCGTYLAPEAWQSSMSSCWLDGARIPGADTKVKKGLHLVEYRMAEHFTVAKLTCNTNGTAVTTGQAVGTRCPSIFTTLQSKGKAGGDDVLECIIFDTALSEKERLEVENYLMHRWGIKTTNPAKRVNLAEGTTLTVGADTMVSNVALRAVGKGKVIKTGTGKFVNDEDVTSYANDVNPAAIDIQGGSVLMRHLTSPIFAGAGKKINAALESAYLPNKVTVSEGTAGKLVKTGSGRVRVTGLGNDLSGIDVQAGTLAIGGETENAKLSSDYWTDEIEIPNAGFETWDRGTSGSASLVNEAVNGWLKTAGSAMFCDFTCYSTQSAYYWSNIRAPEGKAVLHLKQAKPATARTATPLVFREPGEYEFSCFLYGRIAENNSQNLTVMTPVEVKLLASDKTTVVADFGTMRLTSISGFQPKALRARVETAGEYYLQLSLVCKCWLPTKCNLKDASVLVDDLHLRRLGAIDNKDWRLPNGDFESSEVFIPQYCTTNASGSEVYRAEWCVFTNANNHCAGWEFNDPSGWSESKPAVGLINPFMVVLQGRGNGDAFKLKDSVAYEGAVELLFRKNGANVVTTNTPPAGTWRLSALLANKHEPGKSGKLVAKAKIGDEEIDLGELDASTYMLRRQTWPNAFTVDGNTKVTFTITHETSYNDGTQGIVADDFILTKRYYTYPEELLPQGAITAVRNSNKTTTQQAVDWTNVYGTDNVYPIVRFWGETQSAFGYDYGSYGGGEGFVEMWNDCGIYTSLKLPCAGRYRLTYMTRRRLTTDGAPNITFYLSKNGVTNVIEVSEKTCPKGTMERRDAFFYVDEGGEYSLFMLGDTSGSGYQNIGDISIRPAFDDGSAGTPCTPIATDTLDWVKVAEGAKLRLDFSGTKNASHVRLGGKVVSGEISKSTYPDYILGDGKINVVKPGFIMLLK